MRKSDFLLDVLLYVAIYTGLAYIWQGVEWLMIGEIRESNVDTVICLAFAASVYWNVQYIRNKKHKQAEELAEEKEEDDLAD